MKSKGALAAIVAILAIVIIYIMINRLLFS